MSWKIHNRKTAKIEAGITRNLTLLLMKMGNLSTKIRFQLCHRRLASFSTLFIDTDRIQSHGVSRQIRPPHFSAMRCKPTSLNSDGVKTIGRFMLLRLRNTLTGLRMFANQRKGV